MKFTFCPLDRSHRRDKFSCGKPALDDYLKQYARQNQSKGIARTFVASPEGEDATIAGFYSVSMAQIEFESLPQGTRQGLPRYPVPAQRIGQLAVDQAYQGRGLGEELLIHALLKAVSLSKDVGLYAVAVDALDQGAARFYLKYHFIRCQDRPDSLFLPIKTITQVFGAR